MKETASRWYVILMVYWVAGVVLTILFAMLLPFEPGVVLPITFLLFAVGGILICFKSGVMRKSFERHKSARFLCILFAILLMATVTVYVALVVGMYVGCGRVARGLAPGFSE
jgi:hypothetical protein